MTITLEQLAAERDIAALIHRYARAVDGRDFDGIAACYWDDAWEDHAPDYRGPVSGYVEWLRQVMPPGPVLTHQFGNVTVEIGEGGDAARADSYCISTATFPGAAPGAEPAGWMQLGLRYGDELSRRDGVWRFQRRSCRHLWTLDNGKAQAIAPAD